MSSLKTKIVIAQALKEHRDLEASPTVGEKELHSSRKLSKIQWPQQMLLPSTKSTLIRCKLSFKIELVGVI
jgi:hypothetical protein